MPDPLVSHPLPGYPGSMVTVWLEQTGTRWFGVASHGEMLVATVASRGRLEAERALVGCLPRALEWKLDDMGSAFARRVVALLDRLERGDESDKQFVLSDLYVAEPLRRLLRAAASIPLGYVTTYGKIAEAAATDARHVGRTMAANPLYPIVPCHRVVGSDLSLVGYTGSRKRRALEHKLERLRAEIRGRDAEITVPETGLVAYPVEWAVRKAERDGIDGGEQLELWREPV